MLDPFGWHPLLPARLDTLVGSRARCRPGLDSWTTKRPWANRKRTTPAAPGYRGSWSDRHSRKNGPGKAVCGGDMVHDQLPSSKPVAATHMARRDHQPARACPPGCLIDSWASSAAWLGHACQSRQTLWEAGEGRGGASQAQAQAHRRTVKSILSGPGERPMHPILGSDWLTGSLAHSFVWTRPHPMSRARNVKVVCSLRWVCNGRWR